VRVLQMNTDGPDVLGFERCLLAHQLPLVPGFPMRMFTGFHDRLLAVDRSLILELVAFGCHRERCPPRAIVQLLPPMCRSGVSVFITGSSLCDRIRMDTLPA